MKGKLRNLGTESCVFMREESGSWDEIIVDSIKHVKNSSLQISVKKNLVLNSPFRFIQIVHTPEQNTKSISLSSRSRKYEQYAYIHEIWITNCVSYPG